MYSFTNSSALISNDVRYVDGVLYVLTKVNCLPRRIREDNDEIRRILRPFDGLIPWYKENITSGFLPYINGI